MYRAGTGPAVVVVHEIPGLRPGVIAGSGSSTPVSPSNLPSLFGWPGGPVTTGAVTRSLGRVWVAREFTLLADRTSPVTHRLPALAVLLRAAACCPRWQAQVACGGPGVGAVGMCITGGFALAMAVDPAVV